MTGILRLTLEDDNKLTDEVVLSPMSLEGFVEHATLPRCLGATPRPRPEAV